jgi:hypothetical protein
MSTLIAERPSTLVGPRTLVAERPCTLLRRPPVMLSTHARIARALPRYTASGGASSAFVTETHAASLTVTKPTGATTGDHLFIFISDAVATRTITGFTTFGDYTLANASGTGVAHVLYRKIDGTEGSTFTISGAGTPSHSAVLYRGGGNPGIIDLNSDTASSTSVASRVRAPAAGMTIHAWFNANTGTASLTAPGGVTSRSNQASGGYAVLVADEAMAAAADNTRTATSAGQAGYAIGILIPDTGSIPTMVAKSTNNGQTTNATVTVPSTAAVGDLIVVAYEVTAASITAGPTGFTTILTGSQSGGTYVINYYLGWKIAVSGDIGAAKAITSGNQVWGAACMVIRNPGGTPVTTVGTPTTGASPITVGAVTAAAAGIALTAFFDSSNGSAAAPVVDTSTVKGFQFQVGQQVNSGYGYVSLGLSAIPNGTNSLAPSVTSTGFGQYGMAFAAVLPLV